MSLGLYNPVFLYLILWRDRLLNRILNGQLGKKYKPALTFLKVITLKKANKAMLREM